MSTVTEAKLRLASFNAAGTVAEIEALTGGIGFSATSWPMFTSAADAVAVFAPVAPALAWATSAASILTLSFGLPPVSSSYLSVMPVGGKNVALRAVPKKPTTKVSSTVVVAEGAITDVELALGWPPDASTGVVVSTPL